MPFLVMSTETKGPIHCNLLLKGIPIVSPILLQRDSTVLGCSDHLSFFLTRCFIPIM